ncbi:MAG: hypothetical protein Sapg2KO_24550 [Saprospiraceae bacterium]
MTLSPKLKVSKQVNEDDLILKGGSSGKVNEVDIEIKQSYKRVQLRIPFEYLDRIEKLLENRAGNVSRHTWIMEAIVEKLGKEETQSKVDLTLPQP